jgi:hypothetical protein
MIKKILIYIGIALVSIGGLISLADHIFGGQYLGATSKTQIPAYGMVYRIAEVTGISTSYVDVEFTGGQVELNNITHSTSTNSSHVYVDIAGKYEVSYSINGIADTGAHTHFAQVTVNSSTAAIGSQVVQAASTGWGFNIGNTFIVDLNANDWLILQMKVDALTSQYDGNVGHGSPVAVQMYLKRIDD